MTYINCDSTDAYYTTMGTYNPHYFKHYDVNGRVCTADEYLSGLSGRMWVPLDAAYKRDVTSGQSVDYVTPVFNVENGWLIFTIGQSQLCSMLDLSVAHLNTCAILNADGEIYIKIPTPTSTGPPYSASPSKTGAKSTAAMCLPRPAANWD